MKQIKYTKLQKKVERYVGNHTMLQFSVFETIDDSDIDNWIVTNELDTIPIKGKLQLVSEDQWIGDGHKMYRSIILKSPTYLELCKYVDESIMITGDSHHIFFEGVEVLKEENGIKIVNILMGS